MPNAARISDRTALEGVIIAGSADVLVNGQPAARYGDAYTCPHHLGDKISTGSATVLINGRPAAFVGCDLTCHNANLGDELKERLQELLELQMHGEDPAELRAWQEQTGVVFGPKDGSGNNPYYGLPLEPLMFVYEASQRIGAPPEVILALWAKEAACSMGEIEGTLRDGVAVTASTPELAKAAVRSFLYFRLFRLDHFTAYLPGDKDNVLDSDASKQEPAFLRAIEGLPQYDSEGAKVMADTVNQELTVTGGPGDYTVTPSEEFYIKTLILYYQHFSDIGSNSFPQMGDTEPSTTLNYMQWNMGTGRFGEFLSDINGRFGNTSNAADIENWALHTQPDFTKPDWAQPRVNAIKFGQYVQAYALLFDGICAPSDVIETGSANVLIDSD